jgi:hypothetical protein
VKQSRNRPGVAQRVPGGLDPQISWHSAHEGGEVVSLTQRPPLRAGNVLVLISTRGWVDPRAMVRSEGNMSLKNPVTPPGIDPETFRLVAQRLNNYATPEIYTSISPLKIKGWHYFSECTLTFCRGTVPVFLKCRKWMDVNDQHNVPSTVQESKHQLTCFGQEAGWGRFYNAVCRNTIKTGTVSINVTVRIVRAIIGAVEKQTILHILSECL